MAAHPLSQAPETQATGWLWWLPRLSFVLFILAVATLLLLSHRTERAERRATLISDMLWLEQALHFQLTHNEGVLGGVSPNQTRNAGTFEPQAKAFLENQSGLRQVRWLAGPGGRRLALPAIEAPGDDDAVARMALSTGKPVYGSPYQLGDEWRFDVFVPLFHEGRGTGVAVGAYSIQRLLDEVVPWWLMERYRIVVLDSRGGELASRSKVEAPADELGYQLSLDPPGRGLALVATPYRSVLPPARPLLSLSVVLLAGVVLWSLWALRRHMQGRLVAEAALREAHAFRKAMEDSVDTGLRARDLDGRITYVNPAFCRMVGWSEAELVGRGAPMPYWVDEEIEATRELHDRILAGQGPESGFEFRFKRRNGEVFPVLIHEAPLIDERGRQTGWMSSVVDISTQKYAEELARQQQERLQTTARLVTMGEMASSLAHELNQPLTAIASYNAGCLNLMASGQAAPGEIENALKKSAEQARRAGRIIRRIYEFVRRAEPKNEPCELGSLLEEVLGFVEIDARRQGVRIQRQLPVAPLIFSGDRVLLSQTFLNLLRNGIDAMRDMPVEQRLLTVNARREEASLLVSIADQGRGITSETAARLFEPFFTTKTEGMGMGLNICRSVIEGHQGRLWFEANPAGGSVFHVRLPLDATAHGREGE
ncbi:sensor histidine kinase [Denitratisoma oestradiolicum]|nr:PAS domain S-box protein [Denitratisoma oestradiolicum]TWO79772.1 hypothetical protein CBW56_12690 [Denitratisoma oestradiolicum]